MSKRIVTVACGLSALFALASCESPHLVPRPAAPKAERAAAPPEEAAPDESFRATPPLADQSVPFVPPTIVEHKLPNGVRVLLVERHQLPIVAFQLVVDRGGDQGPPGTGAFLGAMLVQGTKKRSALQISDALGQLGAQWGAYGGLDSIGVNAKVLSAAFPEALEILADCVRNPAFAKDEVERERARRLTALAQQKDSPATLLRNAVSELLYPSKHPYHAPVLGNEPALKSLTGKDLAAFHRRTVQPEDLTVAIAGDITKEAAIAEVTKVLGDWKGKPAEPTRAAEPEGEAGPRIVIIDRPGATQSHMAAAMVGVPRSTKDFHALMVMNTILGGQFTSRLNLNLREKHAYTYGASSSFDMRHGAGPFTAGGAIVADKTRPAATEILSELRSMQEKLVSEEELADAKRNLIRRLPASFETVADVAGSMAYLSIYGLPLDEFATRSAAYQAITREDVQRVAQSYLKLDRIRLVIVGDADLIEKELAGLEMGKVEVRRAPKAPAAKPAPKKTK